MPNTHEVKNWEAGSNGTLLDENGQSIALFTHHAGLTEVQRNTNLLLAAASPKMLEALRFCRSVLHVNGLVERSEKIAFDKIQEAIDYAHGER